MTEEMYQQLYSLLPVAAGVLAALVAVIVIVCVCVRSKKKKAAAAPIVVAPSADNTTVRLSKSQPRQEFTVEYEITYVHSDEVIE